MRSNKCIQVLLTFPPGKTKHLKIIPLLSYLNDLWMRFNCPPETLPETWCVSEQQQTNHPYSAFNFGTSPGGADLCLVSVGPDISEQHSGQSSFPLEAASSLHRSEQWTHHLLGSRECSRQVPPFTEEEEEDATQVTLLFYIPDYIFQQVISNLPNPGRDIFQTKHWLVGFSLNPRFTIQNLEPPASSSSLCLI